MSILRIETWMFILAIAFASSAAVAKEKIKLFSDIRYIPGNVSPAVAIYHDSLNPKLNIRELEGGKQIVLELQGGSFPAALTRKIDTSSVPGPLLQILPYNTGGKVPGAKVVLQFRRPVKLEKTLLKDEIRFVFREANKKAKAKRIKPWQNRTARRKSTKRRDEIKTKSAQIASSADESTRVAEQLIETLAAPKEKRVYRGTKVSIEASAVSVHDVFRLLGAASNLNLITTADVEGQIDLSLKDVPWDQVLDIVLGMQRLKAIAIGNVIRITTIENYTAEQDAELELKLAEQKAEPVVMAVIPINYAKAEEIKEAISSLLVGAEGNEVTEAQNEQAATAALTGSTELNKEDALQIFARGKVEIDSRTNSLLVTHTEKQVERIRILVKELDVPTPQVLIEAKILNASENFARTIGVTWGGIFRQDTEGQSGAAGVGFNGFAGTADEGFDLTAPNPGSTLGFRLGGGNTDKLELSVTVAEIEGTTKVMASPRLIVNNKQEATISDGTKIAVITADNDGGAADVSTEFIDASLNLTVTPQVTNSGFVQMEVSLTQDTPVGAGNQRDIDTQSINTEVLVESGSTLVLGGVYTYNQTESSEGVPILKDLPFLGALFRNNSNDYTRGELLMFISPRVIEAAVTDDEEIENEGLTL